MAETTPVTDERTPPAGGSATAPPGAPNGHAPGGVSGGGETKADPETETDDGVEVLRAKRREKKLTIYGRNDVPGDYVAREMTGDDLAAWSASVAKRMRKKASQTTSKDFKGLAATLIHLCLFTADGNRVPKMMIESWGAKTQNRLFAICQGLNGLNDQIEESEGND